MNQAILSPKVIRQDFGETTLNRVRKEMEMSFVARSAREGLKAPGDPDRPNEQTSLGIEDERLSKSKTVTPKREGGRQKTRPMALPLRARTGQTGAASESHCSAKTDKQTAWRMTMKSKSRENDGVTIVDLSGRMTL